MQRFGVCDIGEYVSFGRNIEKEEGLALFWSGSGIEFNIAAGKLFVDIECMYGDMELMLDVILDGERTQKFVLNKGTGTYQVFSGMNPEKSINVRLVRDTQCMTDDPESFMMIKGFETDGCFKEVPEYRFNMEFIGDSLTSGEGCGLTAREEWIPVVFDAIENYAYKTAKKLNARYQVLSQSGWGLYASWDANTRNVLPDYYEQVCGTTSCERCVELGAHSEWDFSKQEMEAVVINLGTNDSGALKTGKFEKDKFLTDFKNKAVAFLKKIRERNGSCIIVWAYGMLGNDMEPYIMEAIEEYSSKSGDRRVEYLRLPDCSNDVGARFHPTPGAHEKAAEVLADFLQSVQAFMLR